MSRCGAVYVQLGEQPEFDVLRRCSLERHTCTDHETQLGWVRADPTRLAAYNEQLRRYDLGQRIGAATEQGALL